MPSPFKFLDSYTKADREIFFGRDREILEMYQKVVGNKLLVLYGISGTGKTSLINCGLANKFDVKDWLPVNIRRGINIMDNMWQELEKIADMPLPEDRNTARAIESIYLDHFKPVYLIFDQFEELFIFGKKEEREEFIKAVSEIRDLEVPVKLIFSIREEYLAGITEFEMQVPDILANRMRIERMTRRYALEVIEGPCKVHGIKVDEGFSEALLEKLNPEGTDVELTYLQVFLDKIYRMAEGEVSAGSRKSSSTGQDSPATDLMFSNILLDKVGDVSDLLGGFLEEQINELDDPDTGLIVLKAFVSMQGTKKQIEEREIGNFAHTLGKPVEEDVLTDLLNNFVNLRLLRDKDEGGRYELRHDSLATKIYEKITLIEKELLEIKDFIDNAFHNYTRRGLYLSEPDLKYIAPFEDKLFLNRKLERFIHDSRNEIEKSRRRRRSIAIAATITLLVVFAGFTIWAISERKTAVVQSRIADEQKNDAIQARDEANKNKDAADNSRREAELRRLVALHEREVADSLLLVAEEQRNLFEQQRNRAEQLFDEADQQRQLAESAQAQAEQSAAEVIEANRQAMFQLYLFNAKELAHKSLIVEDNPSLKSLLALMAYKLINYGYETYGTGSQEIYYDPEILESLQRSYMNYVSDTLIRGEIWALDSKNGQMAFSSQAGQIEIAQLEDVYLDRMPELCIQHTVPLPGQSFIRAVSLSKDANRLVCGTSDGRIFFINDLPGENPEPERIHNHNGSIFSSIFSQNEDRIISSSVNRDLHFWDINSESTHLEMQLNRPAQKSIVLPTNRLVFINGSNQVLSLDLEQLNEQTEVMHSGTAGEEFHSMAYIDNLNWLVLASGGNILRLGLDREGTVTEGPNILPVEHDAVISEMKFSPDDKWLVSASWDGTIMLWSLHPEIRESFDKYVPIIINNPNKQIISLGFDIDSQYLIYGDKNNLRIYPLDIVDITGRLNYIMKGRELTDSEFRYYIKGDLDKPGN